MSDSYSTKKGCPTKLNKELAEKIFIELEHTLFVEHAAPLCGVSGDSGKRWFKRGMDDIEAGIDSDYAYFARGVEKQKCLNIKQNLELVKEAAKYPKNAAQAQWLLSKIASAHFGVDSQLAEELRKEIDDLKILIVNSRSVTQAPQHIEIEE